MRKSLYRDDGKTRYAEVIHQEGSRLTTLVVHVLDGCNGRYGFVTLTQDELRRLADACDEADVAMACGTGKKTVAT